MHAPRHTPAPDGTPATTTAATTARKLRLRYVGIGLWMAFTWCGEGNAPAWEHALRTLVILLILPPLLLRTNRHLTHKLYESAHPGRVIAQLITARIAAVTIAFGAGFLLGHLLDPHAARSPVLPALGFLLLLASIPAQIRHAHRTRTATTHPATQRALSAPRLIATKLTLITTALLAQLLLTPYLPDATFAVAAALFLTTATLGPKAHHRFLLTDPAPTNEKPAHAST
ncbi:hypothetical protein Stsp01_32630 [Streptomyces sp. NBRC 13847]|uniref:hypothetical protein n=1 Tax=Streptomyces TaxID=1883 RepID=UPI0024A25580|nr:hypothetical protein [Streptomyces sp. NBRC 13847]GLW16520.1 hypothetical protein Stsp01_32630 [Streptomyces sp. NBRC 13847]